MKFKLFVPMMMVGMASVLVGCVSTLDEHKKPGIPLVKDSFVSRYQRPMANVNAAARTVLSREGTLTGDNTIANTLTAKVNTHNVYVKLLSVDDQTTQIETQVRTAGGLPNLELARELDKLIAIQLTVQR